MKALELENYGVSELAYLEQEETDGGLIFLPVVMYACWGVMIGCSAVALGMKHALEDSKK